MAKVPTYYNVKVLVERHDPDTDEYENMEDIIEPLQVYASHREAATLAADLNIRGLKMTGQEPWEWNDLPVEAHELADACRRVLKNWSSEELPDAMNTMEVCLYTLVEKYPRRKPEKAR